ncbi:alpha-ketoglutarate-dependent dioxygenase AlkB [Hymenobacter tibetensis]|uniref:Alpha-ketoglutarate-dependent dioxygenase AlkB n=1 Tax=Hymenobacter tibetensis TaxID=497967 RepID=A0ABY4CX02_9BACT|nr:alpha-ketoglutarate-dependent dioxygenase AlkB [Hymenobacter tibetensis]UOG74683.1 alpha-ketoglutarate-dependent dioxygenase AlkB [Hymenobacter tibetensis]
MPLTPISLPQATVLLDTQFLSAEAATSLLAELSDTIAWRHEPIKIFGKEVMQPRLTAWYGDPGARYAYSGLALEPLPFTPALQQLREQVEAAANTRFNSVLLNLYRTGQDSMGWHADDEPELGPEPVIASISLGATRRFRMRPRHPDRLRHDSVALDLNSGSLLLMRGTTQQHWLHAIPKTARPTTPRLNLTFRLVTTA